MTANLQKSEVVIARILQLLIENGLQYSILGFNSLALDPEYEPFFQTCLVWLIDEGLVRSKHNLDSISGISGPFHAYGPVLTSRGFAVLGRHLEVKGETVTIASVIKETSSTKQSAAFVGDFFGGLLGGFTKSMGN